MANNLPKILFDPSVQVYKKSNLHHYEKWLNKIEIEEGNYSDLWEWSVNNIEDFWESVWNYYDVLHDGHYENVIQRPAEGMIGTKWFEGTLLNYSEHIFRNENDDHAAILFKSEKGGIEEISWKVLRIQVAKVANYLKEECGVEMGDRVVSFLPNNPQAVIAFLAVNSLGAIWSSCSPDFGVDSVVDRFKQIKPKVLFAANAYVYNGKEFNKTSIIESLISALPSLEKTIVVSKKHISNLKEDCIWWQTILENEVRGKLTFQRVPFDHPIWILFSSGTTGKPKAITHSNGGNLLEHLKAISLHQDVKKGDRFFWYSTTGWMMWNYALASMLVGSTLVIYDGSAGYPDLNVLWDFASQTKITHFGGGASFYIACMKAGLSFSKDEFPKLRSIGSTGSPLTPDAFEWIYNHVKRDLWLVSLSGGTDVCTGFVGGAPNLPVYKGEIQCRMLGCKIEAFSEDGKSVMDELGELVITEPMPSMPVFFWNDKNDERYQKSYFDVYESIWRHGDWIKITNRGTLIIYGRSDATLNRGGVRIGTSEVYNAVDSLEEIKDSLVVCIDKENGAHFMPMFVMLEEGIALNDTLKQKIKATLKEKYSPRHVPNEIYQVQDIPYTISGKKMEAPVKKILMGIDVSNSLSKDAMRNPEAIDFFLNKEFDF